ncbi:MAG: hypothetical protein GY953_58500, partial [bacterium]|nr:hypothetical protein [bacterium]
MDEPREIKPATKPLARRFSEADLAAREMAPEPKPKKEPASPTREERRKLADDINRFLSDEGAVAVLRTSYKGQHGLVAGSRGGHQEKDKAVPPPMAALSAEHYNRIVRLLKKEVPIKIELEIEAQFHDQT